MKKSLIGVFVGIGVMIILFVVGFFLHDATDIFKTKAYYCEGSGWVACKPFRSCPVAKMGECSEPATRTY